MVVSQILRLEPCQWKGLKRASSKADYSNTFQFSCSLCFCNCLEILCSRWYGYTKEEECLTWMGLNVCEKETFTVLTYKKKKWYLFTSFWVHIEFSQFNVRGFIFTFYNLRFQSTRICYYSENSVAYSLCCLEPENPLCIILSLHCCDHSERKISSLCHFFFPLLL